MCPTGEAGGLMCPSIPVPCRNRRAKGGLMCPSSSGWLDVPRWQSGGLMCHSANKLGEGGLMCPPRKVQQKREQKQEQEQEQKQEQKQEQEPSGKLGDRGGTEVQSRCDLNKMRSNLRAKDKTKQEMKTRDRKGRTSARRDRKGNYISPFGGLPLPIPQAFREGGVDGVVEGLALIERRLPPPESLGIEVGLKFVGRLI